ncbi:MAG: GPR endopeptidase [Candidatus Limivicinus sp.]
MLLNSRTDIASEAGKRLSEELGKEKGVIARKSLIRGLPVLDVKVVSGEGAKLIGKPVGQYFTLELGRCGDEFFNDAVFALSELISRLLPSVSPRCSLVAALGNPDITPDALGQLTASSILVTRHLKAHAPSDFVSFSSVALCRTGVLGTSGVESAVQIKTLCREIKPELVIAVDALAGSDPDMLCRCIQISDTGIAPGSGVGNSREELSPKSLGLPVISIGVPTVIDAAAFSADKNVSSMFVTPRDIDSLVRSAARIIGFGINLALHPGLSIEDVELLLG